MKIAFKKHVSLNKANKAKLETVNGIIEDYLKRGYRLTLRQVYYQLVSRDIIPNNDKEYAKLSDLLVVGRMCGIVDWSAIVDRNRTPRLPYFFKDPEDAILDAHRTYRIDRQEGQMNYVELWVEKDALSEILSRKSDEYHVNLMVNRGYTSCTAVYESFNRFRQQIQEGKNAHILYVGDHDPSGLDMVRDINNRLQEFGVEGVNINHIALTQAQIQQYNPPTNPAKIKDPRAAWYIRNFGESSWEVDALTPEVLHETIDDNLKALIDVSKFELVVAREKGEKAKLKEVPVVLSDLKSWYGEMLSDLEVLKEDIADISEEIKDMKDENGNKELAERFNKKVDEKESLEQLIETLSTKIRYVNSL